MCAQINAYSIQSPNPKVTKVCKVFLEHARYTMFSLPELTPMSGHSCVQCQHHRWYWEKNGPATL